MAFDELTDQDLKESITELEQSAVQLSNLRSREKTLEDAMDAYDGLVKNARRIVGEGLDGQAARLKNMGRAGTGNTQWHLPSGFHDALWLIEDHNGTQTLRNRVLDQGYGMVLADYQAERNRNRESIAEIRRELLLRESSQKIEQAQKVYETEMARIGD